MELMDATIAGKEQECEDTWGYFDYNDRRLALVELKGGALRATFSWTLGAEIGCRRETISHVQQPRFHWPLTSRRTTTAALPVRRARAV